MSGFQRDSYHVLFNLDEFQFSLKGLKILAGLFVAIHLLAALVSPIIYHSIVWWHAAAPNSLNQGLVGIDFPEYFDRTRMILMLLSVPWIVIQCRLLSARKLGYRHDLPWYSNFFRFYLGGTLTTFLMVGILLLAGAIQLPGDLSMGDLVLGLFGAFLLALLIASFEELIFRSLFFRMFYTAVTPFVSLVLSSMFFAYMHFKDPVGLWDYSTAPADVGFLDGFSVAWYVVTGILHNFSLVLFINLSLVGFILAAVFLKTRSLWSAVGLHAGLITPILWFGMLGAVPPTDGPSPWWGSPSLADGYFATLILFILAVYVSKFFKAPQPKGFTF